MDVCHVLGDSNLKLLGRELNLSQESTSDTEKCILWPLMEPIDACAVDQTRELSGSETEGVSYWGEAKAYVEVSLDLVEVEFPKLLRSVEVAQTLGLITDLAQNSVNFILCEELWDLASLQDIVHVDEEIL
jgi:hypothetical protein